MIRYHLTLANLRAWRGDLSHFVTIAQVIVSSAHLFDAGFGEARIEGLAEAYDELERTLRTSVQNGRWGVDQTTFELFADLLVLHETQLRSAPTHAVLASSQSLGPSAADSLRKEPGWVKAV
jgi:hypothetical protein